MKYLPLACLALPLLAGSGAKAKPAPASAPAPAPVAAPAPASVAAPAPAAPIPFGKPAPAWSATTLEAASGEANKAQLAVGNAATLTGEVIDYSCYLQLAKSGEKHRDCGRKCILTGQPAGLLLADGSVVMLMAEEHHPRRDGQVSLREFLAVHVGQTVMATGMVTEKSGVKALFVLTLDNPAPAPMMAPVPAPAPAK